ncbi:ABC transporter ATP-binding protein [Eubacteriales bacterium OttesenSCG-928-N13]|nr:ABC transporter ATP-binding protein [Eubacteriales bacterium OttesenSCG-928-N13]
MTTDDQKRPLLEVRHISKHYDNQLTTDAPIIGDLSLVVNDQDFLCILGPSGCGKTTLLRCIASFENYQGEILVDGQVVSKPGSDRIVVFQDFNQLFPWKTVARNVQDPLKRRGIKDKQERERIADTYLEKVGLLDYRDYYPHQLSGGMKQRVAIAKALALHPRIVLMDEPFASLDAMTRKSIQAELLQIKEKEEMTVIFITHNIQEAIMLGNRIMVMGRGGNVLEDMENPLPKPATPACEGFSALWDHFTQLLDQSQ